MSRLPATVDDAPSLEVPVDSIEAVEIAAPFADRIELCDDLASEGWTPAAPLVRAARDVSDARPQGCRPRIIAMIRPRLPESRLSPDAASFVATERIVSRSEREIASCIDAGAHEIAIGLLDAHGHIDIAACGRLRDAAAARGATVAFLRVFDLLHDRAQGWRALAQLGIGRVLTAGVLGWDAAVAPIEARMGVIAEDVVRTDRSMAIAAGGGVRAANADRFLKVTPHLHASCRVGGRICAGEVAALRACLSRAQPIARLP